MYIVSIFSCFVYHGQGIAADIGTCSDQPTYYHFHIHVVHVSLEAGATQAVGKAFGLENIISQLEGMAGGKGMVDVSLTYHLGEASELWTDVFQPLRTSKTASSE